MTRPLPERETREAQARALLKQLDPLKAGDRSAFYADLVAGMVRR